MTDVNTMKQLFQSLEKRMEKSEGKLEKRMEKFEGKLDGMYDIMVNLAKNEEIMKQQERMITDLIERVRTLESTSTASNVSTSWNEWGVRLVMSTALSFLVGVGIYMLG